jgi:hypothetical protein
MDLREAARPRLKDLPRDVEDVTDQRVDAVLFHWVNMAALGGYYRNPPAPTNTSPHPFPFVPPDLSDTHPALCVVHASTYLHHAIRELEPTYLSLKNLYDHEAGDGSNLDCVGRLVAAVSLSSLLRVFADVTGPVKVKVRGCNGIVEKLTLKKLFATPDVLWDGNTRVFDTSNTNTPLVEWSARTTYLIENVPSSGPYVHSSYNRDTMIERFKGQFDPLDMVQYLQTKSTSNLKIGRAHV